MYGSVVRFGMFASSIRLYLPKPSVSLDSQLHLLAERSRFTRQGFIPIAIERELHDVAQRDCGDRILWNVETVLDGVVGRAKGAPDHPGPGVIRIVGIDPVWIAIMAAVSMLLLARIGSNGCLQRAMQVVGKERAIVRRAPID